MDPSQSPTSSDPVERQPKSSNSAESEVLDNSTAVHPRQSPDLPAAGPPRCPERIGRYKIEKLIGSGGFGAVYLGYDEDLRRHVAVKVPLPQRVADAEAYLIEARILASLDHPNIVPVHDVGRTPDGSCYVVSKFIEGSDLQQGLKARRFSPTESAEVVATVAEALHYAHTRRLVHRDVKPANILIDRDGTPYVADFGLALWDQDFGVGPEKAIVGTPKYMSPEQARGEGHLVDGRTDVFSLGIVFYELLTGVHPFGGHNWAEFLRQLQSAEAKPPRQVNDSIPKELERISLRALSKRSTDRYTTAKDFADDLRDFLRKAPKEKTRPRLPPSAPSIPVATPQPMAAPLSDRQTIKIVPKGLRSFDAQDADFFLELLPGARDRDGLPDTIRFWKKLIEETDPDETFRVGLIYGPSGCGKSSLVKAGLLPRVSQNVCTIYVESTADETESRLLRGLRKRCPGMPDDLDVKGMLAALRHGRGVSPGKKVLIVLDQFEQWLHSRGKDEETELVRALRQCDGARVQCIVMVRDDFWMAVSRFLRELEVRLVEAQNSGLVDLFDVDHARKVLAAFGRALGRLPQESGDQTKEQKQFLTQAVDGLAQEHKVVCVRLALFAEMMKSKAWTPAALKEVGGTEGIGVTFLEESFSATTAPPAHRIHQKATRAVLSALLPGSGTNIKGNMRSRQELLEASGYRDRQADFDELMRILDSEIRLITPTDPDGVDLEAPDTTIDRGQRYYQLTHDYLVPSLRDWLTRKQKETRRGRAELRLAERSDLWNTKPENRLLPSAWEYMTIRTLTNSKKWTDPQRKMMRRARLFHSIRSGIIALVLLVVTLSGLAIARRIEEGGGPQYAAFLVNRLVTASTDQVPDIVAKLEPYRVWADPLLKEQYANAHKGTIEKMHLALALLPIDPTKVDYLREQILFVDLNEFAVLKTALLAHKERVIEPLWKVVLDPKQNAPERMRAASLLATLAPEDSKWDQISGVVADELIRVDFKWLPWWRTAFRPVKDHLVKPIILANKRPDRDLNMHRRAVADLLEEYAVDRPDDLYEVVVDGGSTNFSHLTALLSPHKRRVATLAQEELKKRSSAKASDQEIQALASRQANAAIMLMGVGETDQVWAMLGTGSDPVVGNLIVQRMGSQGVKVEQILQRLDVETDVAVRRALLTSLVGFTKFDGEKKNQVIETLFTAYESEPDAGLHVAIQWVLGQWKTDRAKAATDKMKGNDEQARKRVSNQESQWYVSSQGQTFVVFDAREVTETKPKTEPDPASQKPASLGPIRRQFAVATNEILFPQIRAFLLEVSGFDLENDPQVRSNRLFYVNQQVLTTWFEAAHYCNWLSEKEGIPRDQWCYEPNEKGEYGSGMRAKANYLALAGYRLPTEAELTYALRGAESIREYTITNFGGVTTTYWQYSGKPTSLGLYTGTNAEWCADRFANPARDPKVPIRTPTAEQIMVPDSRVVHQVGATAREGFPPSDRQAYLRPVRTFP
jgi:serine/threonine protein kinase